MHCEPAVAPVVRVVLPASQAVHAVCSTASLNVPSAHGAPVQATVASQYWPARQGISAVVPFRQNFPAEHGAATAAPAGQKVPHGHGAGPHDDCGQAKPAAHAVGALAPSGQ